MDSVIQGDRMRVPPPPSAYNDRDTCKRSVELIHSKRTRRMPEIATPLAITASTPKLTASLVLLTNLDSDL